MNHLSDAQQLHNQIANFQSIDKSKISQRDLTYSLVDALSVNGKYSLPQQMISYPKGTVLYRARKLKSTSLNEMSSWRRQDYWEVPTEFVKTYGRLNEPHESIFYTSLSFEQTLSEVRADDGELVVVSSFQTIKSFPSVVICPDLTDAPFSKEDIKLAEIRNDFLRKEFTRDVTSGQEYLYKVSNQIVKDDFDLPSDASKAWTYPAIGNSAVNNVGMRPFDVHMLLNFSKAVVGTVDTINGTRCIRDYVLIDSHYQPVRASK